MTSVSSVTDKQRDVTELATVKQVREARRAVLRIVDFVSIQQSAAAATAAGFNTVTVSQARDTALRSRHRAQLTSVYRWRHTPEMRQTTKQQISDQPTYWLFNWWLSDPSDMTTII